MIGINSRGKEDVEMWRVRFRRFKLEDHKGLVEIWVSGNSIIYLIRLEIR